MRNMQVAFIHSGGASEITMKLDEGVLKDSIDKVDLAQCIEVITDFTDVEVLDINFD